jgi:hypothetical protein
VQRVVFATVSGPVGKEEVEEGVADSSGLSTALEVPRLGPSMERQRQRMCEWVGESGGAVQGTTRKDRPAI